MKIKDTLTYSDLGGRRHLRRYIVVSIFIIVFILGAYGLSLWQRAKTRSEVLRTPMPLSNVLPSAPTATNTPLPTLTSTPAPTHTPTLEPCPTDPAAWTLVDVLDDYNLKRIEPACVYEGLERTVAWSLLTYMGYSMQEAADMMGFEAIPDWIITKAGNTGPIIGITNTEGPMELVLDHRIYHPDYRNWNVQDASFPTAKVVYALNGCYRTQTVTGDQVEDWGMEFPVVCVLAIDWGDSWGMHELGEHRYGQEFGWRRDFVQFGYDAANHQWLYMGWHPESRIETGHPAYESTNENAAQDRQFIARSHGVVPWDAAWLEKTFGYTMYPLPDEWRTYTDQAEIAAIISAFEAYYQELSKGD